MRPIRLFLALALAAALLHAPARAQGTAADSAWARGDTDTAERLFSQRLAADSSDVTALHRIAMVRAWAGKYEESLALFDRAARLAPRDRALALDRARVLAWSKDYPRAIAALDSVLARDPTSREALEARAQFASWSGRYEESLSTYSRLLEITPEDRSLRLAQARVLSWAKDYGASIERYDSLLRASPDDPEVLLGLAQVLSWSARFDSAEAVYARLLRVKPDDPEALRGLARVASWSGDLPEGERRWRRVLAAAPDDVPGLVGLGSVLRWQGRDAAALGYLRRAERLAPNDADVREQMRWMRAALAPRGSPNYTYESDSDGNRIATLTASGSWRATPRVELRASGYVRDVEQAEPQSGVPGGLGLRALGGMLTGWTQWEPGWTLAAGAGVSGSDAPDADPVGTARVVLGSPLRYPVKGTLSFARSAFDATALLVRNRVVSTEWAASGTATPARGWTLAATGSTAVFRGRESNRQVAGNAAVTRLVSRPLTLGVAARAFGFDKDLTEGYFDPDFYGIVEATAGWVREGRRWVLGAEVAPGWQQVGSGGERTASFRATGRVGYVVGPGRQVGVSGAYANSGLQQLAPTGGADYRYRAVSVFSAWTF